MINNRHDLYRRVSVDGNRELDLLSSRLPILDMATTKKFRIPRVAEGRPDLISHFVYENVDFWWIILEHNNIVDPYSELYTGRLLDIPSINDYYDFYNQFSRVKRR